MNYWNWCYIFHDLCVTIIIVTIQCVGNKVCGVKDIYHYQYEYIRCSEILIVSCLRALRLRIWCELLVYSVWGLISFTWKILLLVPLTFGSSGATRASIPTDAPKLRSPTPSNTPSTVRLTTSISRCFRLVDNRQHSGRRYAANECSYGLS